jgi:hypothetical protein
MIVDTQDQIVDTEDTIDRKELLMQQFDEIETAREDRPAPPQEPKEEAEEPPAWAKPPSSWKREYHEPWQAVDPKLREYIWQRDEETRTGIEPLRAKAQFADQMQQAMQPYENTIRGLGVEPAQAVQALMQADHVLRTAAPDQKRTYIIQLAQQYGITLDGSEYYPPAGGPVDPMIYNLQNELNNVRGEIVGYKQQQEEAQNQTLMSEINNFSQTAEYFEDARPTMIQLLQSGVATTLEDAYEKAIRLNDDLFEQSQQSRQAEAETERKSAANRAAKAAKVAAVSVRSSTPGAATATKAQDRRSMLSEQFNSINDRL